MSVTLLRPYMGFASGAVVAFPSATETALIAQGLATAADTTSEPAIYGGPDQFMTLGGNIASVPNAGVSTPTYYQGPLTLPAIPMGAAALTTFETNGVAQTAGSINLIEIYVPYIQTWTGAGVLNGTVVGTDNLIVCLYGSDGTRIRTSALAGTLSAGASVFQNIAFTSPITLLPGRYFIGVQASGATATIRHNLAANGAANCASTTAGVFGTIPATLTVPATFTTAVGPIAQLYV